MYYITMVSRISICVIHHPWAAAFPTKKRDRQMDGQRKIEAERERERRTDRERERKRR